LLLLQDRRRQDERPGKNRLDYADNFGPCIAVELRVLTEVGITPGSA
jgi:hypothetical protein